MLCDALAPLRTCNEGSLELPSPCAPLSVGSEDLTDTWISCDNEVFCWGGEQEAFLPWVSPGWLEPCSHISVQETLCYPEHNLADAAEPGDAWWGVLSLPLRDPATGQPPSVCANCRLCFVLVTQRFRAQFVLLGVEDWKGPSGLQNLLCSNCRCLCSSFHV